MILFFFSSRRRHTRCHGDWSSDVCSSDLLLNLEAVTAAAAAHGEDVAVFCAGVRGAFALDDAYVAGRVAEGLGWERSDAAEAAVRLARSYGSAEEVFRASRSGRDLIEHGPVLEADISRCARESVLDVVPRLA